MTAAARRYHAAQSPGRSPRRWVARMTHAAPVASDMTDSTIPTYTSPVVGGDENGRNPHAEVDDRQPHQHPRSAWPFDGFAGHRVERHPGPTPASPSASTPAGRHCSPATPP